MNSDGRFEEVGKAASVDDEAFGMGMCAGDVDADGRLDFLVTNYGPDRRFCWAASILAVLRLWMLKT